MKISQKIFLPWIRTLAFKKIFFYTEKLSTQNYHELSFLKKNIVFLDSLSKIYTNLMFFIQNLALSFQKYH